MGISELFDLAIDEMTSYGKDYIKALIKQIRIKNSIVEKVESYIQRIHNSERFVRCIENYNVIQHCIQYVFEQKGEIVEEEFIRRETEQLLQCMMLTEDAVRNEDESEIGKCIQDIIDILKDSLEGKNTQAAYSANQMLIMMKNADQRKDDYEADDKIIDCFPYQQLEAGERIERLVYDIGKERGIKEAKDTLWNILNEKMHIVLLADAGCGKTTELIALYEQAKNNGYHPLYIELKNHPHNELYNRFMADEWIDKPMLILDGLDEIPVDLYRDFVAQINGHDLRNVPVVISSRYNAYSVSEREVIQGFEVYGLLEITDEDIGYWTNKIGIDYDKFMDEVRRCQLEDIIRTPFYFIRIVDVYREKGNLLSRSSIMKHICIRMIKHDYDRSMMRPDTLDDVDVLFKEMCNLAFAMQCTGKWQISTTEISEVVNEDIQRSITGGLLKFSNGEYAFVHNNFREYLAAEYLVLQPLDKILGIIALREKTSIRDRWLNVFSYLTWIYEGRELQEWVMQNCPIQMVMFDRNRVSITQKREVLKRVVLEIKQNRIWANMVNHELETVVDFCKSAITLSDMLETLEACVDRKMLINILRIIECFPTLYQYRKRLVGDLWEILNGDMDEYVKAVGIGLLIKFQCAEEVNKAIDAFSEESNEDICCVLLKAIDVFGLADTHISLFIRIVKMLSGGIYHFGYRTSVDNIIKSVKYVESIRFLLESIKELEGGRRALGNDESLNYIVEVGINMQLMAVDDVYTIFKDFFVFCSKHFMSFELMKTAAFFVHTNTVVRLVRELHYEENDLGSYTYALLFKIDAVIGQVFDSMFDEEWIMDEIIRYIRPESRYLGIANSYSYKRRGTAIVFDDQNRETENMIGRRKYLEALVEKERFRTLVYELCLQLNEQEGLTVGELRCAREQWIHLESVYRILAFRLCDEENPEGRRLLDLIDDVDWGYVRAQEFYHYYVRYGEKVHISDELKTIMRDWASRTISEHRRYFATDKSWSLIYAVAIAKDLEVGLESETLLMMLEIDPQVMDEDGYVISGFIRDGVQKSDLEERIFDNLQKAQLPIGAALAHMKYCQDRQLDWAVELAYQICQHMESDEYHVELAVQYLMSIQSYEETVVSLMNDPSEAVLKAILVSDNEQYIFELAEELKRVYLESHNPQWLHGLLNMQSKDGVDIYVHLVDSKCEIPDMNRKNKLEELTDCIGKISDVSLLDKVVYLFTRAHGTDIKDRNIMGLKENTRKALSNIAKNNYLEVEKVLMKIRDDEDAEQELRDVSGMLLYDINFLWRKRRDQPLSWRETAALMLKYTGNVVE